MLRVYYYVFGNWLETFFNTCIIFIQLAVFWLKPPWSTRISSEPDLNLHLKSSCSLWCQMVETSWNLPQIKLWQGYWCLLCYKVQQRIRWVPSQWNALKNFPIRIQRRQFLFLTQWIKAGYFGIIWWKKVFLRSLVNIRVANEFAQCAIVEWGMP